MWNTQLTNTLCVIAGNWEGRTIDRNNVTCDACIEALPPIENPTRFFSMVRKNVHTGEESVQYAQTTDNVIAEYAAAWVDEDYEVVIRKYKPEGLTSDEAIASLREKLTTPSPSESYHYCDYSKCSGHPRINNYCSSQRREDNGD